MMLVMIRVPMLMVIVMVATVTTVAVMIVIMVTMAAAVMEMLSTFVHSAFASFLLYVEACWGWLKVTFCVIRPVVYGFGIYFAGGHWYSGSACLASCGYFIVFVCLENV